MIIKPWTILEYDPKEENMKIKVLLKVLDKHNLIFQVLWMDERFRGAEHCFSSAVGIRIDSHSNPALGSDRGKIIYIYLQGIDTNFDDKACTAHVDDAYVERNRIIIALKEWALNWKGFKDVDLKEKDSDDDIYCI